MKKNINIPKIIKYTAWVLFIFTICFYFYTLIVGMNFIDTDMSGEMILGRKLFEEKTLLTQNWFYSAELRLLDPPIIFAILFNFFNNWKIVRIISTLIFYTLMLFCIYVFCKENDLKDEFPLLGIILSVPFCYIYWYYTLLSTVYLPKMIIPIICMALALRFLKQKKYKYLTILAIIAFISGLESLRSMLTFFIPLLLSSIAIYIFDENKDKESSSLLRITIFSSGATFLGCLISELFLRKMYIFHNYTELEYIRFSLNDVEGVINSWLRCLGYITGEKVFSFVLFNNLVCALTVFLIILSIVWFFRNYKNLNIKIKYIYLYLIFAFLITFVEHVFSNMEVQELHFLTVAIFVFPIIFIYLCNSKLKDNTKKIAILGYTFLILVTGIINFVYKEDEIGSKPELVTISKVLQDKEYKNGYATFWNSNLLTEFSNGEIKVKHYIDLNNLIDWNIYGWLQSTDALKGEFEGKVFLILSREEVEELSNEKMSNFIIYSSDDYEVYGFQDFETMRNVIGYFYFNKNLENGEDKNGKRYLYKNGISKGPYWRLDKGEYRVTVNGENLNVLDYYIHDLDNNDNVEYTLDSLTSNMATLSMSFTESIEKLEIIFSNNSDVTSVLENVEIKKIN
ncbi:MAG: hypothetical protein IJS47_03100 [Clostridia bacterium]|nr:hypothetical protein [Clostridia bacterium]